ncbi:Phosphoribosylformylglycinamidine synthase, synthetase subunit [Clostridiaceae bacterium JG1575]|nr:Phosphoribosylformylglycinamidine synthase, synthetase subunit [Clostridiaceae bacterium JG1575]
MSLQKDIFVEKRPFYDTERQSLKQELEEALNERIPSFRLLEHYRVEGLEDEELKKALPRVFADPNTEDYFLEAPHFEGQELIVTELLPGQFDMRSAAAQECLQLAVGRFGARVSNQRVLLFERPLAQPLRRRILEVLVNPMEMREGSLEAESLKEAPSTERVPIYEGLRQASPQELVDVHHRHGLAMSLRDLALVVAYFREEGRDPSETELKVLDTYWSDHCRHTTFSTHLKEISVAPGLPLEEEALALWQTLRRETQREHKPKTLMELATLGARVLKKRGLAPDVDESEEINACSIHRTLRTEKGDLACLLQFKNETHNHPTEIEPFGGAATCLGGAIRDPLAGRAYVYQAMRVTGAADPTQPREATLPGKVPQRVICREAARGYSSYGNQMGLAAGVVHEHYHPGYVAKRLEVGAVLGAVPLHYVQRSEPCPGDVVLLVGGRTGRDGVGGATGSSKSHTEDSMKRSGAEVQKGNAPTERKIQRLMRNEKAVRLIRRCNDFGAGGVSVAVGELAPGLRIDLDRVPLKYQGLSATETAVSESQERMAMVLRPEDLAEFQGYLDDENLEYAPIAEVTKEPRLRMIWHGQEVVNLSREFLDQAGAVNEVQVHLAPSSKGTVEQAEEAVTLERIQAAFRDLNGQSQKPLHQYFDSTNGCATVLMPYGGETQETESCAMVCRIPVPDGVSLDASVMSYGFDPFQTEKDPFRGAYLAVAESLAKLVSVGAGIQGAYLSFQEYFQKLGEDPVAWGEPTKALLGALCAQMDFETPAIGGKDSMSGTFGERHVPPTFISFAVATMPSERVIHNVLGSEASIVRVRMPRTHGLPDAQALKAYAKKVRIANENGWIQAQDTCRGGAVPTLLRMSFGNRCGGDFQITEEPFQPMPCDFLLALDPEHEAEFLHLIAEVPCTCQPLGRTKPEGPLTLNGLLIDQEELLGVAKERLAAVYGGTPKERLLSAPTLFAPSPKGVLYAKTPVSRPQVVVPIFPGTNCEYDLTRAFQKAGANVLPFVLKNRDQKELKASLEELARAIDASEILMLPGGFSAGDEPKGSGKFIANVLRSAPVARALTRLLDQREGLILGICNGFQALVRVGLLPHGALRDLRREDPLLMSNVAGHHMDGIARVRVASNASPWLRNVRVGEVFKVPFSHGEGRFMASQEELLRLARSHQIATQYCNASGQASMQAADNPNGSSFAVEGLLSPDGRIFGKMGHNERWAPGLLKNVPGSYDMKLFESGVRYFTQK